MAFQTKFTLIVDHWDRDSVKQKPKVYTKTYTPLLECDRKTFDLAASTTIVIWDPVNVTGDPLTAFSYLLIESSALIYLELTANEGDANEELNSLTVPADGWLLLQSNVSYYSFTTDVFAGTLDVFDKLRIRSGAAAAKVHVEIGST